MTDLETRLAEARKRLFPYLWPSFDRAAAIAREVVAKRDDVIEHLRLAMSQQNEELAEKDKQLLDMSAYKAEFDVSLGALAQMRKELVEKDKQLLDMSAYTAEFNVYREQVAQMQNELAEKDVEIASLEKCILDKSNIIQDQLQEIVFLRKGKVTDAQREAIATTVQDVINGTYIDNLRDKDIHVAALVAIIEYPAVAEATPDD